MKPVLRRLPTKPVVPLSFHHIKCRESVLKKQPIQINLHGFLGSKTMFHSLNKIVSREMATDIYTLDLRNHGDSPQAHPMTYETLTNDLIYFIKEKLDDKEVSDRGVDIVGFSMGAKVGLLAAIRLAQERIIKRIVSIDMPPYKTPVLPMELIQHMELIRNLHSGTMELKAGSKSWREECVGLLGWYFASGFLKVKGNAEPRSHIKYFLPIEEFPDILEVLKDWPATTPSTQCVDTKVLFMRALYSPLFNADYKLLNKNFPKHQVKEFKTSHNLLFEDFENASTTIINFLKR
ncbi:putative hydrolase KNAG_0D03600 [Huiozyma naganishii CBS 8797]|uniref:AB hydrolase-1 domain-containing protein n=1 Tax=Huiozyma naganishii (strain ATCC MYA-139 / BCRC 22969 / CBS 8797 / KCTC 17520 / NBRC 10181 / NCYC 3082 / Yp74L-3) TaxID=1071383 RepID=J7S748_HUIN7|nr:hypothetical protein KNAG_0D03600 [Kazachstania naganishii CBS 8797]CCK70106.1 hypothetical protein KNAG_0D03600 [Kazachstania naganishii CBS 8797]